MSKKNELAALRRDQADLRQVEMLQLRLEGLPYDEIATRFGISTSAVATNIQRALERHHREASDSVLQMELIRLDEAMRIAWEIAANEKVPAMMRLNALDRVLKVQDRRTKYLGLDAPVKTESKVQQTTEVDVQITTLLTQLLQAQQPVLEGEVVKEPPALLAPIDQKLDEAPIDLADNGDGPAGPSDPEDGPS